MAVVDMPDELKPNEPIDCAICSVRLALTGATAGQHNGRGCQLFACVSHFMEVELLICGWAEVVIRERDEAQANKHSRIQQRGGRYARTDS